MPARTLAHDQSDHNGPADDASHAADSTYVVFLVDGTHYAVPVARVHRTLPLPPLTRLPAADPAVLGVFQHAGRIITTWDSRRWFQAGNDPPENPWLIIVDHAGTSRAILVDRVVDVLDLHGGTVKPMRNTPPGVPAGAVRGRLVPPELPKEKPLAPDQPEPAGLDHEQAERRARRLAAATLTALGPVYVIDLDSLLPEVVA